MFDFFRKKKNRNDETSDENSRDALTAATGLTAAASAQESTRLAAEVYAKPDTYTGNRALYDSGAAKKAVKQNAFSGGAEVRDPYTGDILVLTKAEARMRFGDNWQDHLAEADHKVPLEKVFEQTKNNSWIKNEDIKRIGNNNRNLENVSRSYNNAKRSRTNEEFVNDDDYLKKVGLNLSEEGKKKAIASGRNAQASISIQESATSVANALKTGHEAGIRAASGAGSMTVTMSGIMNIAAVINGEKTPEEALSDTAADTGKALVTGYAMGDGLTIISHSLSDSSSEFLRALAASNVPGKVITAVMMTGDILKRYGNGEITTQQCIIELGEKGLTYATVGYSMAVGQAMIPVPVIGAAIGALIGSMATGKYYNQLINSLQEKEKEHQERLRILAECERVKQECQEFREQLEAYLNAYFEEYQSCFDEALTDIKYAFQIGNADGVIAGANKITRKQGGNVYYETVKEFKTFLSDDSLDVL